MTGYIDLAYYRDTYKGKYATDANIETVIQQANMVIGSLVGYADISKLSTVQQDAVKTATCMEVDYLYENPNVLLTNVDGGSFTIGSFSMSTDSKTNIQKKTSYMIDEILRYTGLLTMGVCVR